jgi:hypothetical protein
LVVLRELGLAKPKADVFLEGGPPLPPLDVLRVVFLEFLVLFFELFPPESNYNNIF